ncbi:MAG: class I SAM-dependent methyltransferase [Raoultibacter sp.]
MDAKTVETLCTTTNNFYRDYCDSFAQTRQAPWTGWERCLAAVGAENPAAWQKFSVLDVACGNLRFEAFLAGAHDRADITFYAVDNCDDLLPTTPAVSYQNLDVLEALRHGQNITDQLAAPACDLCVSFGFLHHVPTQAYREKILLSLIAHTRPGGYVIVSLWQFLNSDALAQKAQVTHARALEELGLPALDNNDYLLGWQNTPGAYRYCHSFSEAEIDQLIAAARPAATPIARFHADGKTGNLNTYVVWKVG